MHSFLQISEQHRNNDIKNLENTQKKLWTPDKAEVNGVDGC